MSRKRFKDGDRGIGKFKLGEPATRRNSASIRRLLYDIVMEEFEGSILNARTGLTQALNGAEDQRGYRRRTFGLWSAYNVIRDKRTISFNELDSLGLFHGVSLSLVVLFTQARSEVQSAGDFSTGRALRTLHAMRTALTELENILNEKPLGADAYGYLDYEKFIRLRDVYRDDFGEQQTDLPLVDKNEPDHEASGDVR